MYFQPSELSDPNQEFLAHNSMFGGYNAFNEHYIIREFIRLNVSIF